MEKPNAGQVYKGLRTDTFNIKEKYQLFLDEKHILLINTKKSHNTISVPIQTTDCPLLKYDSYICLDTVFQYLPNERVLKACDVSSEILKKLYQMIDMSTQISGIQKQNIKKIIRKVLIKRESET